MRYEVRPGESPTIIARRFGVPMAALIHANPHKPTTVVNGRRTWQEIRRGETVNVPVIGYVSDGHLGAYSPASIVGPHATIRRGSASTDVATWQAFLGLTADGVFGSQTEAATRSFQQAHGLTVDGVVGPKTWEAAQSALAGQAQAAQQLLTRSVAPSAPGAPHAMIRQGSKGPDVALWQTIIGVTADGIFGPNTAATTKAWQGKHSLAADGIVGPKTWAAALGGAGAPAAAPAPTPSTPSTPMPAVTPAAAPAAVQALLSIDPCYSENVAMVCAAQSALGVTVDGKYGAATATAARKLVPGAPAGCSPRPSWWTPTGRSNCPGAAPAPPSPQPPPAAAAPAVTPAPAAAPAPTPAAAPAPAPAPVSAPTAVQTLLSIDPCDPANAAFVCQAQGALGVTVDGKYGPTTATAARRMIPSAPAGCSPRPSWWTPAGQSSCPGAAPSPIPSDSAPSPEVPPASAPASAPPPGMQPVVVPPEKKGVSTGAIVAGSLGVAALVGLVAVAATRKKPARRAAHRRPSSHKTSRKSAGKRR